MDRNGVSANKLAETLNRITETSAGQDAAPRLLKWDGARETGDGNITSCSRLSVTVVRTVTEDKGDAVFPRCVASFFGCGMGPVEARSSPVRSHASLPTFRRFPQTIIINLSRFSRLEMLPALMLEMLPFRQRRPGTHLQRDFAGLISRSPNDPGQAQRGFGFTIVDKRFLADVVRSTMKTVDVKLGSRSYQVQISSGLLDQLGARARTAVGENARQAIVVSNATVSSLYLDRAINSLERSKFKVSRFLIGDGERFKTLRTAESLFTFLIEQRAERSDVIAAIGGGVVGDLAGFAAAAYLRGIRFIQVPTTLLAQIDSSVGGKTGVNHPLGKNLIGAFHQPSLVVIDPEVLLTLPMRQMRAGLYEAIKYGVISDHRLFNRIATNMNALKNLELAELEHLIARCCAIKARVVRHDERESGLRKILNFGHTVGHALEAVTHYRRFLHGEAVGYGMRAASRIAERLGLLTARHRETIDMVISSVGRLPNANTLALGDIISAMDYDKKAAAGRTSFVLPVEIGKVVIRSNVPPQVIRAALAQVLS